MEASNTSADSEVQPKGRPRDPERDEAILAAAEKLLIQDGYDGLTIERVAASAGAGKATVYRRWSSKAQLVMEVLVRLKPSVDDIDTGTLDADLDLLTAAACSAKSARANQVMCSVANVLAREPELLATFREHITEPRVRRIAAVLERARARGELADDIDIELAASLVPSLMLQRAMMTGRPVGRAYAERIVGSVLLPALGRPRRTSGPADD